MIFISIALLILFACLTAQDFFLGVLLVVGLLPSYLIRFTIFGIPTTFLEGMMLIVIGLWVIQKIVSIRSGGSRHACRQAGPSPTQHDRGLMIAIMLLCITATIGLIVSPDKHAALGVYKAFYLEPILFFFVLVDTITGKDSSAQLKMTQEEMKTKIFRVLGISALFISLFGIVQWIFGVGIPSPWDLERRITSVFDYPNALALFLEPIIVISWFEITKATKVFRKRAFWIATSVLASINVFLAQSEAGIAALIVTAFCLLLLSKQTRQQTMAAIFIISTLAFTVPLSRNYLAQKFTFHDASERVRLSQWTETIALLKDHPFFGAGLSGYPIALKPYHKNIALEIFQYPHNIILNIWVELGLLGLVAFWLLAWRIVRISAFGRDGLDRPLRDATKNAIPFIFFEMTVHGLVDVPYFKNDLAMLVWILLAVFIVDYVRPKTSQTKPSGRT